MSAASIAAEVEGVGGQHVSAQTIRRTLHQIGLHGCHPRRKPLLKTRHECVLSTVNHGGGGVMVWGCMSAAGTGRYSSLREP